MRWSSIVRVLDRNGWRFQADVALRDPRSKRAARADLWIPVRDEGDGCAVVVTKSVLQREDLNAVISRIDRLHDDPKHPRKGLMILVVVNGYLSDEYAQELENRVARVIVYDLYRFAGDIDAALNGLMTRIEGAARELDLGRVLERVEQVGRQSANIGSDLERLTAIVSDGGTYERAVEAGVARFFARLSGGHQALVGFPRTRAVFDAVRARLKLAAEPLEAIMYRRPVPRTAVGEPRRDHLLSLSPETFGVASAAIVLDRLVEVFEESVSDALERSLHGSRDVIERVVETCRWFDAIVESRGVAEGLSALGEWESAIARGGSDEAQSPTTKEGRMYVTLQGLGPTVYDAVRADAEGKNSRWLRPTTSAR